MTGWSSWTLWRKSKMQKVTVVMYHDHGKTWVIEENTYMIIITLNSVYQSKHIWLGWIAFIRKVAVCATRWPSLWTTTQTSEDAVHTCFCRSSPQSCTLGSFGGCLRPALFSHHSGTTGIALSHPPKSLTNYHQDPDNTNSKPLIWSGTTTVFNSCLFSTQRKAWLRDKAFVK